MIRIIDNFLNSITMYRIVLYGLIVLVFYSFILSLARILPNSIQELVILLTVLLASCFGSNFIFEKILKAPVNTESWIITALILFFLFFPPKNLNEIFIIALGGLFAMASKYILAVRKRHIFNPAALGAVTIGLLGSSQVGWWVGTDALLPLVTIVGVLIVRKIRKFSMLLCFMIPALITIVLFGISFGLSPQDVFIQGFISWPLVFFATIMLTEPLTMPPTKKSQLIFGALVGFLFSFQKSIGPITMTPEMALLIGNIFAYTVGFKEKLFLQLKQRIELSPGLYEFVFIKNKNFDFIPGQYMEWTLPVKRPDSRGNRRYFTIASSPTEDNVRLGVKVIPNGSSFKKHLYSLEPNDKIVASQLTGDFTLPKDKNKKLVFIAGGIGVTPFRSIIKYLIDKNEKRDMVLFYAGSNTQEFIYKNVFEEAKKIGLKTIYIITRKENVPSGWQGEKGYLTNDIITAKVPDYKTRYYFLSGPQAMVGSYKKLLRQLRIPHAQIHTDYFPGF